MVLSLKKLFCFGSLALGVFSASFSYADTAKSITPVVGEKSARKSASIGAETFEHTMQLYLADAFGLEVPGTEFLVNVTVIKEKIKEGYKVTLQLPSIGFVTGPFANDVYETANPISELIDQVDGLFLPPPQNGGYLYTKAGYLPKELRPNDVLSRTFFGPCNNGQNIPFHLIGTTNLPLAGGVIYSPPIPGYLIRVTNSGGIAIEGMGTLANIIPPGTQQLLATDITYIVKKHAPLTCQNTRISKGAINVAQYTFPPPDTGNVDYVRDHHVNDAWDNVVAYAWSDNSNIPNAASNPGVMNLAYSIGTVKDGKLKMRKAQFLPTPNNMFVWDTAIAINRTNSKNIVISYLLIDANSPADNLPFSVVCAAVSFDGGKTWPINGPTNIQPTGFVVPGIPGGAGDLPGVRADKFGNFWYMGSNLVDDVGNETNVPYIWISSDQGQTWELVYTFPYDDVAAVDLYDYPSFTFGGDGQGNYGVHINVDFFPGVFATPGTLDGYPAEAFIPITGLGAFGTPQETFLPQFLNNIFVSSISVADDGKKWIYGSPQGLGPGGYPFPGGWTNNRIVFKSPGPLDENYAGPFGVIRFNTLGLSLDYPIWNAAPVIGFFQSVQTSIYDDKREALYVILNANYPELSNNSNIYFLISRDNGLSWSNAFRLNTTSRNNRAFPSMALDRTTGNLLVGWYDCRDYKDGLSFNYWGTVIPSSKLNKLVKEVPKSNPLFAIPAGGYDVLPSFTAQAPLENVLAKSTKINKGNKNKKPKKGPSALARRKALFNLPS